MVNFNNPIKYYDYYKVEIELLSALCISDGSESTGNDIIRDSAGEPYIPATSIVGACRDYLRRYKECYECDFIDDVLLFGPDNDEGRKKSKDDEKTELDTNLSKENSNQNNNSNEIDIEQIDREQSRISPLIVNNVYFKKSPTVAIRDGIAIDYISKQVAATDHAKYDYEVINPFSKADLLLELVVREDNDGRKDGEHAKNLEIRYEDMKKMLVLLYKAFNAGDIRLGMKKTRGLGKIKLSTPKFKHYQVMYPDNNESTPITDAEGTWWNFDEQNDLKKINKIDELILRTEKEGIFQSIYHKMTVKAKLSQSMIIRAYGSLKDDVDYKQLSVTCKNDNAIKEFPVIPGTSINGVFRHGMTRVLLDIIEKYEPLNNLKTKSLSEQLEIIDTLLNECLGYVNLNDDSSDESSVMKSRIVIDDAYLKGVGLIKTTRTAINRFDQSVKTGALYTSMPAFRVDNNENSANAEFVFYFPKDGNDYKWIQELIKLTLLDMHYGYLPLGGETAIGRGIFEIEEFEIEKSKEENEIIKFSSDEISFGCSDLLNKMKSLAGKELSNE